MMDGFSPRTPRAVDPGVQFSGCGACAEPLMTNQRMQQYTICYQWFKLTD